MKMKALPGSKDSTKMQQGKINTVSEILEGSIGRLRLCLKKIVSNPSLMYTDFVL